MMSRLMTLAAPAAFAFFAVAAMAQVDPAAPPSAASAAPAAKPRPRLMTPAEAGDSASPRGELRPERPVTPQLTIPFGKKPPGPTTARAARPSNAASSGGIDDATARCEAQPDAQLRAACRARPVREPNR